MSPFLTTYVFLFTHRFNKAKNDLDKAEKKVHQLETRNNELSASLHQLKADLARAVDEKKVSLFSGFFFVNVKLSYINTLFLL